MSSREISMSWARQGTKPFTVTISPSPQGSPKKSTAWHTLQTRKQAQGSGPPHPQSSQLGVWLCEPGAGGGGRALCAGVQLSLSPCGRAVIEGLWLRCQGTPVEEDVGRERRRRVLQTLVWFLLTLLLALFIPDIGKVISVIGGLAACFIFVFPGAGP